MENGSWKRNTKQPTTNISTGGETTQRPQFDGNIRLVKLLVKRLNLRLMHPYELETRPLRLTPGQILRVQNESDEEGGGRILLLLASA